MSYLFCLSSCLSVKMLYLCLRLREWIVWLSRELSATRRQVQLRLTYLSSSNWQQDKCKFKLICLVNAMLCFMRLIIKTGVYIRRRFVCFRSIWWLVLFYRLSLCSVLSPRVLIYIILTSVSPMPRQSYLLHYAA